MYTNIFNEFHKQAIYIVIQSSLCKHTHAHTHSSHALVSAFILDKHNFFLPRFIMNTVPHTFISLYSYHKYMLFISLKTVL